jgi:hypothetical protein
MSVASAPSEEVLPRRPAWIWPWRPSPSIAGRTLRAAQGLSDRVGPWPCWCVLGAAVGTLPLLIGYAIGRPEPGLATALLLTPLLAASVVRDALGRGFGLLGAAFFAHNALAVALVAVDPAGMAPVLSDGHAYWEKSRAWIETGICPEYDLVNWLPAHLLLLVLMVAHTYLSLGLATLCQGLHEVDLMNYYVGQLVANSHDPWRAVLLGWHPWSVCRGIGYLFLTFEVASWSLARLTGTSLSTTRRRTTRWGLGLGFLVLDGLIKYRCLESVRRQLAVNLLG